MIVYDIKPQCGKWVVHSIAQPKFGSKPVFNYVATVNSKDEAESLVSRLTQR